MNVPDLPEKVARLIKKQLTKKGVNFNEPIVVTSRPYVYHSATSVFYSPSDPSGAGGMRKEIIRASPSWRRRGPRYDCVYIVKDPEASGFRGLHVARVWLFFAFEYAGERYECALVHWFMPEDDEPDEMTGMWIVEKDEEEGGGPAISVIHIDTILRAAHLIPVFGARTLDLHHDHRKTLDVFERFYVNKYIDCHANEIAF